MAKDFPASNPKVAKKTVVLTLEMDADNMTELYGRIATIVASVENSADVKSVEVKDGKPAGVAYRGLTNNF
jgi:hypothetical protein